MESLYEVNSEYNALLQQCRDYAEENNGELSPELSDKLKVVEMAREVKIENTLRYYKNEEAKAELIAREIEALSSRLKTHSKNAAWAKEYLTQIVQPGNKIEFGCGKISWRESKSVEILIEADLPEQYKRIIPETKEPDKKLIMEALKNDTENKITWAKINTKSNIQLK